MCRTIVEKLVSLGREYIIDNIFVRRLEAEKTIWQMKSLGRQEYRIEA